MRYFSVNEKVKVKLTDLGRIILEADHSARLKETSVESSYIPPVEDENGWSEWKLWELMASFGKYLGSGFGAPFETTIQIASDSHS